MIYKAYIILKLKYLICFLILFSFIFTISSIFILAQEITINVTGESGIISDESVEIFDQQDLEDSQKTTLLEFLQTQSFLYIAKGVDDSEIGFLVFRGFSTSRIAIFLDGIPVSLEQINAMKLPLNIISKIIIYKGNVTALFGPNAVGGAIIIWTKTKQQGLINFVSIYFSSLINSGVFFHLSYFNNNLYAGFDFNVKNNYNIYTDSFGKSDLFDIFSKFNLEYKSFSFSILLNYFKKYLPNDLQFPYFNTYREALSLLSFLRINELIISLQYLDDYFICDDYTYNIEEEKKLFYGFLNLPFTLFSDKKTSIISNISIRFEYLNDHTLYYKNLYSGIISSSIILNKNFITLFDLVLCLSTDLISKYSNNLNYFLMPSVYLNINKKMNISESLVFTIFGKIATAYRLPSFSELYSNYGIIAIGNPDLKPEKSFGFEAGTSAEINTFKANLSFYYYYFDDFIVWIRRFDNRFKPINFAKGYNLGIDFDVEYVVKTGEESYIQFVPALSITIPKILEGLLVTGEVFVPYVPLINFIFNIVFVYIDKIRIKFEFIYRGIRFITIENYNWFSPYTLINLDFTYSISQKSNIIFSIKNLLGSTYYDLLYYPISNMIFNIEFSFYI